MTYICIKCQDKWVIGSPTSEYSGGLCESCATSYVRTKQRKQGFHDCYKKAIEICSRAECNYWNLCNKELLV
jgi:hypothetical protein